MFFNTFNRLLLTGEYYTANNKQVTASEVTQIIRRQFASADLSFVTNRNYGVDPNMIVVSGTYDSDDDKIEVILNYHPEQKIYRTRRLNWNQLSFDVAECAVHELIHREQHYSGKRYRRYRGTTEDQTYLGDEAEIDAYAFSIVANSLVFQTPYQKCHVYKIYKKTFDKDPKVIVKLDKQISKYFKRLEPDYEQNSNRDRTRVRRAV
jgi:hypothetical protein